MKMNIDSFMEAHRIATEINEAISENRPVNEPFLCEEENLKKLTERFDEKSETPERLREIESRNIEKDLKKMLSKIDAYEIRAKSLRRVLWSGGSVVAAMLLVMFLIRGKELVDTESSAIEFSENVTVPTLILENGKKVQLGQTMTINNIVASKKYNIEVNDKKVTLQSSKEIVEPIYTTIVIPHQFTYTVVLDDSTQVILNADSRLRYPVKFVGENREVELEGEAYFIVKKSEKPFIVKNEWATIKVYGTEFNVRAQKENFETILIRGSVGVTPLQQQEIVMKPNTLLSLDKGVVRYCDVNSENYTSWLSGVFYYDKQPLWRVLDDLSRWYGVAFKYNKNLSSISVSMNMSKETTVDTAINFMQQIINRKIIKEERGKYIIE